MSSLYDIDTSRTILIIVEFSQKIRKTHPNPIPQQLNKNAHVLFFKSLNTCDFKMSSSEMPLV